MIEVGIVGVGIVKTEEVEESGIKYLNINVSDDEVERNPDIVRICADAGILEYVKSKTGRWLYQKGYIPYKWKCNQCSAKFQTYSNYCPYCGARMVEPQESEE